MLSAAGVVLGSVGAVIGFLVMVMVGGAIIYGFTLVLGLVFEVLFGGGR